MSAPQGDLRSARHYKFAIIAILIVALGLRLFRIGANSFWVDEINVLSLVRSEHMLGDLRTSGGPFEPPLHYIAVWLATMLPIGFESAARIPAVVFGTLEVLGIVLVARRLTDRRDVALLAGIFLAVAPFAVRYSQENRYYTTFSALHLISWWLVVRALQSRQRRAFLWWGGALGVMVLAHPFAPLVMVMQIAVIGWTIRRGRRVPVGAGSAELTRNALAGLVTAAVLAGPWFLWGAVRWVPDLWRGRSYNLNPQVVNDVALDLDLFKRTAHWLLGNGGRWTLLALGLTGLAVASVVLLRGVLQKVAVGVAAYGVLVMVALVPLAWVLKTYFAMRRIEFLLPVVLLLAAMGTVAIANRLRVPWSNKKPAPGTVMTSVAATVSVLSMISLGVYFRSEKTDYRELAVVIAQTAADDVVVVGPVDRRWRTPVRNYLDWQGIHRRLHFMIPGGPLPHFEVPNGQVVWVTGSPPGGRAFRTRPLNSLPDLQVIAGDRSTPGSIVPWFVSVSTPRSATELQGQVERIGKLAVLLPPSTSSFPWSLFNGR